MAPGPNTPGWMKLRTELQKLRASVGAESVYVFDASSTLWCWGHAPTSIDESAALRTAAQLKCKTILKRLEPALQRGGSLDLMRAQDRFRSFANIYILILEGVPPTDRAQLNTQVEAALPEIERLTLCLPPQGPGSGSAEGFGAP